MGRLREFVYIDNDSLNNSLSSLGRGISSEVTRATEDQTKKGGEGGLQVVDLGAKGEYITSDIKKLETTLDITAPYRFQELLEELDKQGYNIKENPDPRGLSRGDIVKVKGNVYPMFFLKFKIALNSFKHFMDPEFNKKIQSIEENSLYSSKEQEEFNAVSTMIDRFSGGVYPIRIEGEQGTYCTELNSEYMRQNVFDVFMENESFWLFGRVKRHVPKNKEWTPIHAIDALQKYSPEENGNGDIQQALQQYARKFNISMEDDDFKVKGHTAVIEPISMYW